MKRTKGTKKEHLFDKSISMQKVTEILFLYPDKDFTLSALAEEANISKSTMSDIVNELVDVEFIRVDRIGKKTFLIRANRENPTFIKWKIVNNMKVIYESGIVEYLYDKYDNPKAIILFGSFRWGQDGKDSDVDIAIEVADDIGYDKHKIPALQEFEHGLSRNIQIHIFNRKNVDINVFNNIANGIVLYGFLEVNK